MQRKTLHTSEVHSSKNMVEVALRNISPDAADTTSTYIPNQDIQATISLLREAADKLETELNSQKGRDIWFWTAIHQRD